MQIISTLCIEVYVSLRHTHTCVFNGLIENISIDRNLLVSCTFQVDFSAMMCLIQNLAVGIYIFSFHNLVVICL